MNLYTFALLVFVVPCEFLTASAEDTLASAKAGELPIQFAINQDGRLWWSAHTVRIWHV
jgi:hypothetical protein